MAKHKQATWHRLALTTPTLKDDHRPLKGKAPIKYVQRLLNHYLGIHLKVDGEYGLHTARAVQKAKNHLGYRKKDCRGRRGETAGALFVHYLQDPKHNRTKRMKAVGLMRRKARERRAKETPMRVKALHLLGEHLGVSENPPNSNRNMFTIWYRLIGPWCAICQSWARNKAGQKLFQPDSRYAFVPFLTADAVSGHNGLTVTSEPEPGDFVVHHWAGEPGSNPMGDHVGAFVEWTNREAGQFRDREGNTSLENDPSGSQSDGGILTDRDRTTATVVHFIRVREGR